ncbi:MAG: M1 family metallopeptidase [Crocinitomicaceae bacterium]|nr:M1 family metallopeptidase [Crocinitomicaceae bacterium]
MKNIALLLFPVLLILFACKAPQINEFDNGEIESSDEAWEEEEYYDDLYDFNEEEDAPKVREIYNPSNTILTDLVHTKLEVSFNWEESQLNGKATITAKPHFYESDKLILDAKGMDVLKVQMNGADLNYTYNDALKLNIDLGRTYKSTEQYTISIEYVSKPDELEMGGSSAITGDKGLYFINPKGEEKNKMPQIWTQGETQANSVWFPTIDSPNAKTTQEIYITVEDKYVTLSNGDLVSSKKNKDGTRTDYWKQDLPHAPYLFMMAIGEYSIVKDSYTKKDGSKIEVNYYVEPEHKEDARGIFGETPNMIGYFSELLDLEYPWDKYNQVVVRDYVSGAMENTGAVIFGEYVYKDKEDLLDGNDQSTIAHELFHHWFGDLVTCESWANLPLNESFANYSQYLWDEYRYGMDEADYQAEMEADGYFQSASYQGYHDLIWFDHFDKEDMFDGHSYNKGGRILHMLRSYLGDEAFFKGLNNYLTTNKYKAAEFHHLRLAFEEVSGEDLNWFFNQWFLGKGHLILFTDYEVTDDQTILFKVKQRQNIEDFPIYKIPTQVLIWSGDEVVVHDIVIDELEQEFELSYSGEIKNIQIDPKQDLLAKIYEEKSADQFRHQFYNSKAYKSRIVGLRRASKSNTVETQNLLSDALDDPFWNIRIEAASIAYQLGCSDNDDIANKMLNLAKNDSISKVRAEMIQMLDKSGEEEATLLTLFKQMVSNDPSSNVRSSAFQALVDLNPSQALTEARLMEDGASLSLKITLAEAYSKMGEAQEQVFFEDLIYNGGASGEDEMRVLFSYLTYALMQDIDLVQKMPKILGYYKENGGGYVAMYYDRIIAYSIEQCQEIINALVIEENVTESDQLLQVVSELEKLSEE